MINLSVVSRSLSLPTPVNLSFIWGLGSLLLFVLLVQVVTGIGLVFNYVVSGDGPFEAVVVIMREVNYGFLVRQVHMVGASAMFVVMYLHVFKALFNSSFILYLTWLVGVVILLLTMLVSFVGYVLPWGNMGLWAATVITSFVSALPWVGEIILEWVWGGYCVSELTLGLFFTVHFLLPFIILALVFLHFYFLHWVGSSNVIGYHGSVFNVNFDAPYLIKDSISVILLSVVLMVSLLVPYLFSDPENFILANHLSSPLSIQPEWYFLPLYSLLRSSNTNLGGLISILIGVVVLSFLPSFILKSMSLNLFWQIIAVLLVYFVFILGWVASGSADASYSPWGYVLILSYYSWYILVWLIALLFNFICLFPTLTWFNSDSHNGNLLLLILSYLSYLSFLLLNPISLTGLLYSNLPAIQKNNSSPSLSNPFISNS